MPSFIMIASVIVLAGCGWAHPITRNKKRAVLSGVSCQAANAYLGDTGFAVSNGPAFSLDGKTMYFNDSAGRKTFAYDIECK